MKGESSVTDILIITGILAFSLALAMAGVALVFNIATNAQLSASEEGARDISDKILKLTSNTLDNLQLIYVLPKSQTAGQQFNVSVFQNTVSVGQQVATAAGKKKHRIGTEILPNTELYQKGYGCTDVLAVRIRKEDYKILIDYCRFSDVIIDPNSPYLEEDYVINECEDKWNECRRCGANYIHEGKICRDCLHGRECD